ncbi:MAG: Hsp70 family protein, partial [Vicinamibacterales bacterium]
MAYVIDSSRNRSDRTVIPEVLPIRQEAVAAGPSDRFPSVVGTDVLDQRRKRLLFGWDFLSMFERRSTRKTPPLRRGRDFFSSVKSDMGSNRTYPFSRLEKGRTPVEVTARLLEELVRLVRQEKPDLNLLEARVVLTVPASFSALARTDTLDAAEEAGFSRELVSLLDEPVAALLDAVNHPDSGSFLTIEPHRHLMFDYGGGTCDLAQIEAQLQGDHPLGLHLKTLAISPYKKLGGDDIDRAIVADVLWPQICTLAQKDALDPGHVVSVSDTLAVTVARRLKEQLCAEIRTRLRQNPHPWPNLSRIKAEVPVDLRLAVPGLEKMPKSFSMSGAAFEELMERFVAVPEDLDDPEDCPLSLIRPVCETLAKVHMGFDELDRIILNGGGSLNPFVRQMLERQFGGEMSLFANVALSFAPSVTSSVARGAALSCYWEHARGTRLVAPILSDPMGVIVQQGRATEVIHGGQALPFPGVDDLHEVRGQFFVPVNCGPEMLVPYFTGYDGPEREARHAGTVKVAVPPGTPANTDVTIHLRVDEDKTLHWWFAIGATPPQQAESVADPWTQEVPSPQHRALVAHRRRIRECVSEGKELSLSLLMTEANLMRMAEEYSEAIVYLNDLNEMFSPAGPSEGALLNIRALCHDALGQDQQALQDFARAAELMPADGVPRANLGCMLQEAGRLDEAEAALRLGLQLNPTLAYAYERLGAILRARGREQDARRELSAAEKLYAKAAEERPLSQGAGWNVARVRAALGDYEGAERARRLAGEAQDHDKFGGARVGVIS